MMHTVQSIAIQGLGGQQIDVEVDISHGIPAFSIVGLGDTAVQESRERVRSALKNSGCGFPSKRITVNLAPADTRKSGPSFDLPIALGILFGDGTLTKKECLDGVFFLGELALDGKLREINGILPAVLFAKSVQAKRIIIPKANLPEASIIENIEILGAENLEEIIAFIENNSPLSTPQKRPPKKRSVFSGDFSHIRGQERAKRALMIAAAGGHNILLEGPPGSGKTLLARAFESILPEMDFDEIVEVSKIYSVAGLLSKKQPLIEDRPFRVIHHTASEVSIIGGGRTSKPGEVSLAHKGVLFLDEFLEFESNLLETLRQPLEDGNITVTRVHGSYTYPANFLLIGAMNPCPCGYLGDNEKSCICSDKEITRYRSKLSGPILDRIDIFLRVPRLKIEELENKTSGESSDIIREKIRKARSRAKNRFIGTHKTSNSELSNTDLDTYAKLENDATIILSNAVEKLSLSARAYFRIIRVARTIADLGGSEYIQSAHIAEALSYRG